ncbi:MAG: DUF2262 domain-containing protein [Pseudomonadota bacterium]
MNASCLGDADGETARTAEALKARLSDESLVIWPDSTFEVYYDDGSLFCGYAILVQASLAEGATQAEIYR